jgi:hypothetical protein
VVRALIAGLNHDSMFYQIRLGKNMVDDQTSEGGKEKLNMETLRRKSTVTQEQETQKIDTPNLFGKEGLEACLEADDGQHRLLQHRLQSSAIGNKVWRVRERKEEVESRKGHRQPPPP